jgi:spore germination protein
VNGNHISFDVSVDAFIRLNEDWVFADNAFSNKFLERTKIATEKEIKRMIHQTMRKLQNEYKIDAAGFGEQVRIHYPQLWNQIKKD